MTGAIAHDTAQDLRDAVHTVLREAAETSPAAAAAFARLVDVLESSPAAVIFASDSMVSTQQAAALLGVSRMTVVRLVDRGELAADTNAVHRRIPVSELARYQRAAGNRRRGALEGLARDITDETPPDAVISTR